MKKRNQVFVIAFTLFAVLAINLSVSLKSNVNADGISLDYLSYQTADAEEVMCWHDLVSTDIIMYNTNTWGGMGYSCPYCGGYSYQRTYRQYWMRHCSYGPGLEYWVPFVRNFETIICYNISCDVHIENRLTVDSDPGCYEQYYHEVPAN